MDKDSGKLEQIVFQFLLKILHVVLGSRIPSLHTQDQSGELSSVSRVRKSDRWFNFVLGDRPAALESLNFWHRNILEPMIIDIILVQQSACSESADNFYSAAAAAAGPANETVIERWVVQYESPRVIGTQNGDSSSNYKKTYKKSIILLRSLYSHMRLLPAYRIFRQLSSSSQNYNFDLIYKVSSFSNPFSREEQAKMVEYNFVPVEAFPGRLCVSVTYHPSLSDFNIEPSVSLPTKIITDYVGSPTTDPMRYFPTKGHHAASFSLRGAQSPHSGPSERPHSWTSGFHRASPFLQNQNLAVSPPVYGNSPMPFDVSSPPIDMYGNKLQNYRLPAQYRATGYDDYQLSPPFSPTASPSPPTYLSRQNRVRSETAPVTIPHPLTSKSFRYLTPNSSEPSRHSLPPLSPRSIKHDPSSRESPTGIRSYRRIEALTAQESPPSSMNNYGQKLVRDRDSKEDSGRFSGLYSSGSSPRIGHSRSSSRFSLQDDMDDCDFSCPFDMDDADTADFLASLIADRIKGPESASHSVSGSGKSQDAAVGVLVHRLRTAPPLQKESSCYSSCSVRTEFGGIGTASGFFMPRRMTDALEELNSYRDMKDLILSKSGTQVIRKDA